MAAIDDASRKFARRPLYVIELVVPGTIAGQVTFRFSLKDGPPLALEFNEDIRPYLLSFKGRQNRLRTDQALTQRGRETLTFRDDPNAPDFPSANFTVTKGGTFWKRLLVAQPDLRGSDIDVKIGFADAGLALSDFRTVFQGRVEDFNLLKNGNFQLVIKDRLLFRDLQVPSEISDTNLLNGSITASATTITVDVGSEVADPASLPSKDLYPITIRLEPDDVNEEDVILASKSGNVLTVQDNHLDKSEKLDDAAWLKFGVTVTPNLNVGPFGGEPIADLLTFASTSDEIVQLSSVLADNESGVFSLWIRRPLDETADGTITLGILRNTGAELTANQITFTDRWQRFDVSAAFGASGPTDTIQVRIRREAGDASKVLVYGAELNKGTLARGFYASTDGNEGADAGRGAFGTTATAHDDDDVFKEVLNYSQMRDKTKGVHPIFALRDLVNRAGAPVASVDEVLFADQFNFLPGTQVLRGEQDGGGDTAITKPARLSETIKELREQTFLDLWVSETGLVRTRFGFVVVRPGETPLEFTDEDNFVLNSFSYQGNSESRVTRLFVYYDQKVGADGTKAADFNKVQVFAEAGVEAASGTRSERIFSKWIFRAAEALETAGRTVGRFKRGARILKFNLDIKDEPDFDLGDLVSVDSDDILIPGTGALADTAVRAQTLWQVRQRKHERLKGLVGVELLEAVGRKVGFISPDLGIEDPGNPFPDFPDASVAEKQYGFIGDVDNLVNVGTEDGYYIL